MRRLILCAPWLVMLQLGTGLADEGYGSLVWGTPKSACPAGDTLALPADSPLSVVYDAHSQFAGRPARRWMYFLDGELAAVVSSLNGQADDGPTETEIFTAARSMLAGRYGPSRQVEASEIPAGWLSREDGSPGRLVIVEEWTTPQTELRLSLNVVMALGGAPVARHRIEWISRDRKAKLLEAMAKVADGVIDPDGRIEPRD